MKWVKIYHIWYIEGDFWGVLAVKVYMLWCEMGMEGYFESVRSHFNKPGHGER